MNHRGDSEHPCHILNLREKLSVFQIKYDVCNLLQYYVSCNHWKTLLYNCKRMRMEKKIIYDNEERWEKEENNFELYELRTFELSNIKY